MNDLAPMFRPERLPMTRRHLFGRSAGGIGAAALSSLLSHDLHAEGSGTLRGLPDLPHHAPKAKRVIYLMQAGAPSHLDLFDYKPHLNDQRGVEIPASVREGVRLSTMTSGNKAFPVLPALKGYHQDPKSGIWMSDLVEHTRSIPSELTLVKSMHTEAINHAPAVTFFLSGH